MENKRKEAENMEEYCPVYEFETEEELSESEIWDEVMFDYFPNATEEELEDELDSWFND
jgi:hypothetical protein